jgi:GTPase SAR1 family protein
MSLSVSDSWQSWNRTELETQLRASKLDSAAISRLLDEGWESGDVLPELTIENLKAAEFKPGHIAAVKRFMISNGIPNAELNPDPRPPPPPIAEVPAINSLAIAMRDQSTPLHTSPDLPQVLQIPKVIHGDDLTNKIRAFVIGSSPPGESRPNKRILVLGATGSGKTTWINGMANFLYSVQWTDPFRFKVVTEEEETGANQENRQAFSQTEYITTYKFAWQPGFPGPYDIELIDTPGFLDTRGFERDVQIAAQLKALFDAQAIVGADHIDGIAFVVQASNARLTANQRYIFDSMLSRFALDAVKNLVIMATWADLNEPVVVHALRQEKIAYREMIKFNNSALYARVVGGPKDYGRVFWEMGMDGYRHCFEVLGSLQTQSLLLTRELLRERDRLQAAIQGIHRLVARGTSKLDEIEQEEAIVGQHRLDIEANRNFRTTVRIQKADQVRSPPGLHVTNCVICNMTCHHGCAYANNEDKKHCIAMNGENCKICPGKCFWRRHENQPFYWDFKEIEETRTLEEIRAKYADATTKKASAESILSKTRTMYKEIQAELQKHVENARRYVNRLAEIAARPNPLSSVDYIDLLIQAEEIEKKSGWQSRVRYLHEVREFAETGIALQRSGDFTPKQWASRSLK